MCLGRGGGLSGFFCFLGGYVDIFKTFCCSPPTGGVALCSSSCVNIIFELQKKRGRKKDDFILWNLSIV